MTCYAVDRKVLRVTRRLIWSAPIEPLLPCAEPVFQRVARDGPMCSLGNVQPRDSFVKSADDSDSTDGRSSTETTATGSSIVSLPSSIGSTPVPSPRIHSPLLTSAVELPLVMPAVAPVPTFERGAEVQADDPWAAPAWATPERQRQRQTTLGLDHPLAVSFTQACEFVSLGGYCGVAFSLQALGLKRFSYPFDWVRSPVSGVIRCLENNFEDFLTYDVFSEEAGLQVFGASQWGGSFWHHDPRDEKVRLEFRRRVDRLLGRRDEVPALKHRVFVRIANSTTEIASTMRLFEALGRALPNTKIYLLVLVDMQQEVGLVCLPQFKEVLFCRVHKNLFADTDAHFAEQMRANTEAYSEAVAHALCHWAGANSVRPVATESVEAFARECVQYDGGDPAVALYTPRHVN